MVDERIAVIGGGITGLAAAHRLTVEHQLDTVVFEGATRLGGRIDSSTFAGSRGTGPDIPIRSAMRRAQPIEASVASALM